MTVQQRGHIHLHGSAVKRTSMMIGSKAFLLRALPPRLFFDVTIKWAALLNFVKAAFKNRWHCSDNRKSRNPLILNKSGAKLLLVSNVPKLFSD